MEPTTLIAIGFAAFLVVVGLVGSAIALYYSRKRRREDVQAPAPYKVEPAPPAPPPYGDPWQAASARHRPPAPPAPPLRRRGYAPPRPTPTAPALRGASLADTEAANDWVSPLIVGWATAQAADQSPRFENCKIESGGGGDFSGGGASSSWDDDSSRSSSSSSYDSSSSSSSDSSSSSSSSND